MKKFKKRSLAKIFSLFIFFAFMAIPAFTTAQEKMKAGDLENLQDENMEYMSQIYSIVKDYPAFSYTYTIDDGEVVDVTVTGVDNDLDQKRLEVMIFDLKSNKNMLKNQPNRLGVFYSVDDEATYNGTDLDNEILENIEYPEGAENWGVEGTVFVQFVIDENGEIPFATTSENIETSIELYVEDLEEQAVDAIKATSGSWEPAEVEGVDVPSLAVMPITFDRERNPTLGAYIR